MTRFLVLIPIAVIAIGGIVLGISLLRPQEALRDPAVGRAFPAVELEPVGQRELFNPAEEAPEGPALVNVWASWCAPCIVEHPMLMELAESGLPIYGVDWKERAEGAGERFLSQRGSPFIAVGADDGPAGVELGITGVPETFVVDSDGTILARYAGPLDVTVMAKVIEPALARAGYAPAAGDEEDHGEAAVPSDPIR